MTSKGHRQILCGALIGISSLWMACPQPLVKEPKVKWKPFELSLSSDGKASLSFRFSGRRGVARDGFGKPIATLLAKENRLVVSDLDRSPFCSVRRERENITVLDAGAKPLLSVRPNAQGLAFSTLSEERVMKHQPGGKCLVVGTAIAGTENEGAIDVDQGSAPPFSARGTSCFAALTLSLNELPFMERLCVLMAAENAASL